MSIAALPCEASAFLGSDPLEALDAVACGVVVLDAEGIVTYANADALALLDFQGSDARKLKALLAAQRHADALDPGRNGRGGMPLHVEIGPAQTVGCVARSLADGRRLLTLTDVTPQVAALRLARADRLTGLANRTELRAHLGEMLECALSPWRPGS